MVHVEKIVWMEKILALIIRYDFSEPGVHFFTPDEFSQQLAYMNHPKGYEIDPHVHHSVLRSIEWTQEVLFIKKGRVRIDFYDQECVYLESRILNAGDVVFLAHGGHGLTMLEASEIIEVKQGPYAGKKDKTRFKGVSGQELRMKSNEQ